MTGFSLKKQGCGRQPEIGDAAATFTMLCAKRQLRALAHVGTAKR
jgi:hypothetical protein